MRSRALLVALLIAAPLAAQRPRLEITLPPAPARAQEGPTVHATSVISDSATRRLLESGFPTRLHFRVERWTSGGWFSDLLDEVEWDVLLRYDALQKRYRLVRVDGDRVTSAGQFTTFEAAVKEVERPSRAELVARPNRDRQYFIAVLDVVTLSANDLTELEEWLRGELQPAVRGDGNAGTAIGRGVRRLFARLLGAERRNLQARSPTFRLAPEAGKR